MSPHPYLRPKPSRARRGTQTAADDRCVYCACGSHKNCRSASCTCLDPAHDTSEGPSGAQRGSQGPATADSEPAPPTATDQEDR